MNINTIQNARIYISDIQTKINTIPDQNLTARNSTDSANSVSKADNPEKSENNSVKQEISSKFVQKQEEELTKGEKIFLAQLKQTDKEVKRHEMAHIAAGGRYIQSGANYSYKTGPDGKRYVVGGEVSIDTSPVPGDPQATIEKMSQVRRAALAPANPSPQDRKVASTAMTISTKAMSELMVARINEKADLDEEKAFGNIKQHAENAYVKVQNMPGNQQEPLLKISA